MHLKPAALPVARTIARPEYLSTSTGAPQRLPRPRNSNSEAGGAGIVMRCGERAEHMPSQLNASRSAAQTFARPGCLAISVVRITCMPHGDGPRGASDAPGNKTEERHADLRPAEHIPRQTNSPGLQRVGGAFRDDQQARLVARRTSATRDIRPPRIRASSAWRHGSDPRIAGRSGNFRKRSPRRENVRVIHTHHTAGPAPHTTRRESPRHTRIGRCSPRDTSGETTCVTRHITRCC
jgi:hypothetical protein